MGLLFLQDASVSFGAEDILQGITCELNPGDRVGLVGRNGAGKTTLLHLLAGLIAPSPGRRQLARFSRCFLVEQIAADGSGSSDVRTELLSALEELQRLEQELQAAASALSDDQEEAAEEYARLLARIEAWGGFAYESRASQIAAGLGFKEPDWDRPLSTLSGGERARLSLAKGLLAEPDILLMDEPTNHLDLKALRWLEEFLNQWRGIVVVASHDRYFLDRFANRIWYLEDRQLETYKGNYSKFEELLAAKIARQQKSYDAQQEFIAKEEEFIRRYRAGQRAREARGRATKLARVERIEAPKTQKVSRLRLEGQQGGELALTGKGLSVGYGSTPLVRIGAIELEAGARVALVGPNGAGKTTLLKTVAGELEPVTGEVRLGVGVKVAHYWQEAENLDPAKTPLGTLIDDGSMSPQQARDLLGRFLFSGDDVSKVVEVLSGGERSRLALAKLVTTKANLLLLDEPTNHLDIPSRESLEDALSSYAGTVIFASHDRRLISRLATRLWVVEAGALTEFEGSLEEFEKRAQAIDTSSIVRAKARSAAKQPAKGLGPALEAEIAACEARLRELEAAIVAASERADVTAINDLGREFNETQSKLDLLVQRWFDDSAQES